MTEKKRILTGIRPTGPLHLGHYSGALENWLRLQDQYQCYFLIADYQALGDHVEDIERIRTSVIEVALDWLAIGLKPKEAAFVIQSYVPEHAELSMLLSMITPLGRLQRNPTLKAEMERLDNESLSLGFFNYPVSQIADILLPKAHLVPVGEDQLPHIEMTREITRKFNRLYGEVFPEPEAIVGKVGRLVGTDGQAKMSKSLNNCIYLGDDGQRVTERVMTMYTDPTRLRPTDPGKVEGNPVFMYHDVFNPNQAEVAELKERYATGRVGDVEVKRKLAAALNSFLDPIRERRRYYQQRLDDVRDILLDGTRREKEVAEQTMYEVRSAMRLIYTASRPRVTTVVSPASVAAPKQAGVGGPIPVEQPEGQAAFALLTRLRVEPVWEGPAEGGQVTFRVVPGIHLSTDPLPEVNARREEFVRSLGLTSDKAAATVRKEIRRRVKGGGR